MNERMIWHGLETNAQAWYSHAQAWYLYAQVWYLYAQVRYSHAQAWYWYTHEIWNLLHMKTRSSFVILHDQEFN